jgi:hypothetical protein
VQRFPTPKRKPRPAHLHPLGRVIVAHEPQRPRAIAPRHGSSRGKRPRRRRCRQGRPRSVAAGGARERAQRAGHSHGFDSRTLQPTPTPPALHSRVSNPERGLAFRAAVWKEPNTNQICNIVGVNLVKVMFSIFLTLTPKGRNQFLKLFLISGQVP